MKAAPDVHVACARGHAGWWHAGWWHAGWWHSGIASALVVGVAATCVACGSGVIDGRSPTLIDDLEDGDAVILSVGGRQGSWFELRDEEWTPPDGTAAVLDDELLAAPGLPPSQFAAHVNLFVGSWGGGLGVSLTDQFYDGSAFSGITFWARRSQATGAQMFVNFPNVDTHATGACKDVKNAECNNHFACPVTLTTSWSRVVVFFSQLTQQEDWMESYRVEKFRVDGLKDINFTHRLSDEESGSGVPIELWVDDVAFIRHGEEQQALTEPDSDYITCPGDVPELQP